MVIDRPSLAVVHCWRSGHPLHAAPKVTVRAWLICRVTPAGQVTVPEASSTAKSSAVKPPSTAGRSGPGFRAGACFRPGFRSGAVESVAGGHRHAVLRIRAARPGGHRHLAVSDQPGARLGCHMTPEPVPPLRLRLAGMPGLAVHGRDHPVRRDLAGDPPPPVGPVASLRRLYVLPGD